MSDSVSIESREVPKTLNRTVGSPQQEPSLGGGDPIVEGERNYCLLPDTIFEELKDMVASYNSDPDSLMLLEKAYKVAMKAHGSQKRASGEPYITHPLEVAKILADIQMDITSVIAALLHDTVEDTKLKGEDIRKKFGKEVENLVDGVTKLTAISASKQQAGDQEKNVSRLDKQAENLRKIFLAMAKDIRVILIKVADRLHNLRTLDSLAPHKQKRIAQETLEIFAPITGRLGMWEFKWQLEDLAFSYAEPEEYKNILHRVSEKRIERETSIENVKNIIRDKMVEAHISNFHIEGRAKHLYSIYQKMIKKNKNLDEIYDIVAVRIIVNSVQECYQVLGTIHNLWMPLQDRFKDYIAMPKSNNYRSLHTTVYGPGSQPLEVQIRTWEMHRVNEFGIAAHWAYKEMKKNADMDINMSSEVYPWIRRILDWQDESRDARDYIENLKLDLLESEVFVFTPKGDVIDLPAGSTPIDFAYRIHTEVGHRCIGAKVNGKIVSIEYQLKNADIIEILTSKHGTPSRDWLNISKSNHAKNKIRQWFKKEKREENIIRGKELTEKELKRNKLDVSLKDTPLFKKVADKLHFMQAEDLFASVGYGETTALTVINKIKEIQPPPPEPIPEILPPEPKKPLHRKKSRTPIRVKEIENLMIRFAKCCSPVFGDEIMGYITLGKGVSIHRKDCPNYPYLAMNKERLIDVSWDDEPYDTRFPLELELDAWDRQGLLAEVMNLLNEKSIPTRSAKAWAKGSVATIKLQLELKNKEELDSIIKDLKKLKDVTRVFRVSHKSYIS